MRGISCTRGPLVAQLFRNPLTTQDAVLTFFALLHDRRGDHLDAWLEQADASGVRELATFAEGIRRGDPPGRAGHPRGL